MQDTQRETAPGPAAVIKSVDTMVVSVSLFHFGTLISDQSTMTFRRGMGTKVEIPVTGAFIEMSDGEHILFDTGMLPPGWNGHEPPARVLSMIGRYLPEDDIRARLRGKRPGKNHRATASGPRVPSPRDRARTCRCGEPSQSCPPPPGTSC